MTDEAFDSNASRLADEHASWEFQQYRYKQLTEDILQGGDFCYLIAGFILGVVMWWEFIDWAFGMFPL